MNDKTFMTIHGHDSPCRLCETHTPTCHAACKAYSDFRAICEANRAKRSRKREFPIYGADGF